VLPRRFNLFPAKYPRLGFLRNGIRVPAQMGIKVGESDVVDSDVRILVSAALELCQCIIIAARKSVRPAKE
jgi:hypothetical protein